MTDKPKSMVPKVRFKGFTDDWEQRKLGRVFKERKDKSASKSLLSVSIDKGITPFKETNRKNNSSKDKHNYRLVLPGDIAYNSMRLWQGALGVSDLEGIVSPAYTVITPIGNEVAYFYYYMFKRQSSLNIFQRNSQGLTSDTWNLKFPLFKLIIFYATSVEEEKQISKLLLRIDNILTLQQRKLNQLNTLKKALLQKMFADKDHLKPELRFCGFNDEWEQHKGKDIFKSVSEKGYPDLPVLSATQDKGMVYRDKSGIDIKYNQKSLINYKRIEPGDFVVHLRSFQGGFAYSNIEGIASPAYTVFTFKHPNNFSDNFWKEKFISYNFIQTLKKVTYGVRDGRSISYSDFLTLNENYPKVEEQQKIGMLFKTINLVITFQQKHITNLQSLKKFLLQTMFI